MTKENLLVTLADRNFIQQAKQLFSSAYWNAGWKGDYMLLAHEIPEKDLKWFRDKGILIKKCKPIYNKPIGVDKYPAIILDKFYLFTPEFKKWKHIIFLDGDMIIGANLDKLTKTKNFSAVKILNKDFRSYFSPSENEKISRLKKEYNLVRPAFNSGVMAFDTEIIQEDTFDKLVTLFKKYKDIINTDDSILNLFFYEQWEKIPRAYNIRVNHLALNRGIIVHFERSFRIYRENDKPWETGSPFYEEWKSNLEKADLIDLNKIPEGKKWNWLKTRYYSSFFETRNFYFNSFIPWFILRKNKIKQKLKQSLEILRNSPKRIFFYIIRTPGRLIGKMGIFIKKYNPNLYHKLKKLI